MKVPGSRAPPPPRGRATSAGSRVGRRAATAAQPCEVASRFTIISRKATVKAALQIKAWRLRLADSVQRHIEHLPEGGVSYFSGLAACDCARCVPPPAACGAAFPVSPPSPLVSPREGRRRCSSRARTLPVPATAVARPDAVAAGGARAGAWCWVGGDAACWSTVLSLGDRRGGERRAPVQVRRPTSTMHNPIRH